MGINYKKKNFHADEAQSERGQNLSAQYWITIGVRLKELVFIDEAGVNLAMPRLSKGELKKVSELTVNLLIIAAKISA